MSKGSPISDQELHRLTGLFKLMSDRTRLNILMLLAAGERNVSSLCEELSLPQPTVSHHLGLLRQNGLIANRRHGKQVFYGLNDRVDMGERNVVRVGVDRFHVEIRAAS